MPKVVIYLEGGNIQDIVADSNDIEIIVVDFDDDVGSAPHDQVFSFSDGVNLNIREDFVLRATGRPDRIDNKEVENMFREVNEQKAQKGIQ